MTRYAFHLTVHARPTQVAPGSHVNVNGVLVQTLDVQPSMLAQPMRFSFEEAAERLQQLPRLFLEPDGSFVFVSSQQDAAWQVDGVLYDRGGQLLFVDLKGECSEGAWQQILSALGGDTMPLMFQLVRQAVFLDEREFRRCCQVR